MGVMGVMEREGGGARVVEGTVKITGIIATTTTTMTETITGTATAETTAETTPGTPRVVSECNTLALDTRCAT